MASYRERDTSIIPNFTFSFVESYIESNTFSSESKSINNGYKYYSEGYIHNLKAEALQSGCKVTASCYESQRRNEDPYQIEMELSEDDTGPVVNRAQCKCDIGIHSCCDHITGLLYQLAHFNLMGVNVLPEDAAEKSLPQSIQIPRGQERTEKTVQDAEICEVCSKIHEPGPSNVAPQSISPTLYRALISAPPINWTDKVELLSNADPDMLILDALKQPIKSYVASKFGPVPFGSVLSYQQKVDNDQN